MLGPVQPAKRKFEEMEEARMMSSFAEEPQSILNMSMCKLRMPILRREPSLRRSVLIFNTLRHIERELKRQGVTLPTASSPGGLWQPEDMAMDTLDPPPGAEVPSETPAMTPYHQPSYSPAPAPTPASSPPSFYSGPSMMCSDFHNYNAAYTEYSDTSREAEHLDTDSSGESSDDSNDGFPDSPGAPCSPSNTPPTSSYLDLDSPSNTTTWSDLSTYTSHGHGQQTSFLVNSLSTGSPKWSCSTAPMLTTLQTFSSFSPNNGSSGVSYSSQQDAFGDIDISMYDFDLATISPTMKQLSPPGVSTEDLLLSIPSESSSFKCDLLGDDLDHIMQILVGI